MTDEFHKGDRVRHEDDRQQMITGTILDEPSERRSSFGMTRVRWVSGVVENIHISELWHLPEAEQRSRGGA